MFHLKYYISVDFESDPIGFKSPELQSYFVIYPANDQSKLEDDKTNKNPDFFCEVNSI